MPTPRLSDEVVQEALDLLTEHGSPVAASAASGIHRQTLVSRVQLALARGLVPRVEARAYSAADLVHANSAASRVPPTPYVPPRPLPPASLSRGVEVPLLPQELRPVEQLLDEREHKFAQHKAAKEARKLIRIPVKIDGPIAIAHFGDPHIDDDGCDISLLRKDVDVVKRTRGMYAMNCGDTSNNWVGRLARLWEQQSTSGPEAWQLVEWFLREIDWLVILGGNHGAWSGTGDPVRWIIDHGQTIFDNYGARVALMFPNGREVRINARHDFRGHSMWNPAHGPMKAAKMGWRDHILTCGHTHVSGIALEKDPSTGLISHIYRVASYKTYDRYAHEEGLPDQNVFCNVVTIIDPSRADNDPNLVRAFYNDVEHAADYLTWIRERGPRVAT
jgi:hypothetical protein